MKRSPMILLAVLWPAIGAPQPAPVAIASPELRAYANGVKDPAHVRTLGLPRLDVAVDIRGTVSETTVTARFANPTQETLEGDFRLWLPPGAVVTGYALDVDGRLVDGVLVDRPRARAVYNERVRRGVDPGVAEVTPENVFQTSIHPVLPHQGRTVRVRFALPIPVGGYHLPLAAQAPGEERSIQVHASGVGTPPIVQLPGGRPAAWASDDDGHGYRTGFDGPSSGAGELAIAQPVTPAQVVSQHQSGERVVEIGGSLPAEAMAVATRPERLRIYWDRSRAHQDADTATEISLVRQLIERRPPTRVELVAFNSSGAERTTVTTGTAAAAWLAERRYRGARSYAALAGDEPTDHCLLVADGGPVIDRAQAFEPPCRLDAVSASPSADRGWLRHVAASHGGVALALDAAHVAPVLDAIAAAPHGVVSVTDQDGRRLPFLPLDARPGRWSVLARLPAGGPLVVSLAGADGPVRVQPAETAEAFDAPSVLLAADRLATLGATEQRTAFVDLSRRYGISSPSLSYVVLETPADYLAAKIEPPASYPADRRDTYFRARKEAEAQRTESDRRWLDQLAGHWAETVAWWRERHDPKARPARVVTSRTFDRTESTQEERLVPAGADGAVGGHGPGNALVMASPVAADLARPEPPPPPPAPPMVPAPAMRMQAQAALGASAPAAKAEGTPTASTTAAIQIDPWQPDRPYLELYDGRPADFDARFLEAEARHGRLPIFYLDTAEWLRRHNRAAEAPEMVLSALDLPTANEVTLGIVADRLERYGEIDRAIELRERQAVLDPDRPQPRRLLALALARRARLHPGTAAARADLQRAVELLYAVATTPLDGPWDGIETISLVEANDLLPQLERLGGQVTIDPRFVQLLDVDVRVVIDWTTDGSDMDLWVDEPSGERAIYNNPRTAIGGHLSHDMTRGYGPEEYMLHRAPPGTYLVQANVYAPDRLDPNGATLITAHLFRNYGRTDEHEESVDVEVTRDDKGAKPIGRLEVAGRRP